MLLHRPPTICIKLLESIATQVGQVGGTKGAIMSAPAKAAAQATVTLKHLAATLADSHDLAKKQAEAVLGDLVTLATKHLKRGDKVRLTALGILQVRKRRATDGPEPGDRRGDQDQGQ